MLVLLLLVFAKGCKIEDTYENDTRSRISVLLPALVQMYTDIGFYPSDEVGLQLLVENTIKADSWKGSYINKSELKDSWENKFIYKYEPSLEQYFVYSMGANGVDDLGEVDDIFCDSFCPNPERSGHVLKWKTK